MVLTTFFVRADGEELRQVVISRLISESPPYWDEVPKRPFPQVSARRISGKTSAVMRAGNTLSQESCHDPCRL